MKAEMWVKILTFSSGAVLIVSTFVASVPTIQDTQKVLISAAATAVIGLIDLGLYVFFQVKKPIETAFQRGVEAMRSGQVK